MQLLFEKKETDVVLQEKKDIPVFKKSLHSANFICHTAAATAVATNAASTSTSQTTAEELNERKTHLNVFDLYWFWKLMEGNIVCWVDEQIHRGPSATSTNLLHGSNIQIAHK